MVDSETENDSHEESLDEDEVASSGSEEGDDSDAEDEESTEEEEIEPRVLPDRGTRGNRMTALVEEDEADKDFWGQEFFQEEERDTDWESSDSEQEDVPDSDFDLSEDEGGDEGDPDEPKERKQRALAPPGDKKRKLAKRTAAAAAKPAAPKKAVKSALAKQSSADFQLPIAKAPTLRASTRVRVEFAEQERAHKEQVAKRRSKPAAAPEFKPLTQEELLSEAAKTELENLRSLQLLLAREEEKKKRTVAKSSKYAGPIVRYHSKRVDDIEKHVLELVNMKEAPAHMRPQAAPPAKPQPVCAVTGQPAKYRHPQTGTPYATLAAYSALASRILPAAHQQQQLGQHKRHADYDPGPGAKRQRSDEGLQLRPQQQADEGQWPGTQPHLYQDYHQPVQPGMQQDIPGAGWQ